MFLGSLLVNKCFTSQETFSPYILAVSRCEKQPKYMEKSFTKGKTFTNWFVVVCTCHSVMGPLFVAVSILQDSLITSFSRVESTRKSDRPCACGENHRATCKMLKSFYSHPLCLPLRSLCNQG